MKESVLNRFRIYLKNVTSNPYFVSCRDSNGWSNLEFPLIILRKTKRTKMLISDLSEFIGLIRKVWDYRWCNMIGYLPRHDFTIYTADVYTSVKTCFVVSIDYVSSECLVSTDTTVVWPLEDKKSRIIKLNIMLNQELKS